MISWRSSAKLPEVSPLAQTSPVFLLRDHAPQARLRAVVHARCCTTQPPPCPESLPDTGLSWENGLGGLHSALQSAMQLLQLVTGAGAVVAIVTSRFTGRYQAVAAALREALAGASPASLFLPGSSALAAEAAHQRLKCPATGCCRGLSSAAAWKLSISYAYRAGGRTLWAG